MFDPCNVGWRSLNGLDCKASPEITESTETRLTGKIDSAYDPQYDLYGPNQVELLYNVRSIYLAHICMVTSQRSEIIIWDRELVKVFDLTSPSIRIFSITPL